MVDGGAGNGDLGDRAPVAPPGYVLVPVDAVRDSSANLGGAEQDAALRATESRAAASADAREATRGPDETRTWLGIVSFGVAVCMGVLFLLFAWRSLGALPAELATLKDGTLAYFAAARALVTIAPLVVLIVLVRAANVFTKPLWLALLRESQDAADEREGKTVVEVLEAILRALLKKLEGR